MEGSLKSKKMESASTQSTDEIVRTTVSKLREEPATIEDFFSDENESDDEEDYKGGGHTSRQYSSLVIK